MSGWPLQRRVWWQEAPRSPGATTAGKELPCCPHHSLGSPARCRLAAGILIVVAQLLMLPFDPNDHVATSTDPGYQIAGGIYMVGFCALMVA